MDGSWDPVPWMVGGGAKHSTNVARNVAFSAFGGIEGIVSPGDCEVRELAVPGTQVRVFPGTVAIENQATGVRDEMYVGRLPIQDVVPIASTDATGGRSDLIVARVENPFLNGEPWGAPADPTAGPYIFSRVISDVPASTTSVADLGLGYSAIALARIDIPASTGTITQDMITDLRHLSQRQVSRSFDIINPTGKDTLGGGGGHQNWPSDAVFPVDVPTWATHVRVKVILGGVVFGGDGQNGGAGWNIFGDLRCQIGVYSGALFSQDTMYNLSNEGGHDRATLMCGAPKLRVPPGDRGKVATIRVEGTRAPSSVGEIYVDGGASISIDVEFLNDADTNG